MSTEGTTEGRAGAERRGTPGPRSLVRRRKSAQALALRARSSWSARPVRPIRPWPLVFGSTNRPWGSGATVRRETPRWSFRRAPSRGGSHRHRRQSRGRDRKDSWKRLPDDATHSSTRSMAEAMGMSQTSIGLIWRAFGLQPHRAESFKLSTDPLFVDESKTLWGSISIPLGERAVVLCVDESSQIQALARFQRSPGP